MEVRASMGLKPEHFKHVVREARGSRIGYIVRDKKNGNILRFYFDKKQLMCEARDPSNNRTTCEVVDISKIGSSQSYKDELLRRIREENPDKSEEQIEYEADLLVEGRKTIERLVQQGTAPHIAWALVKSALNEKISSEEDVKKVIDEVNTELDAIAPKTE